MNTPYFIKHDLFKIYASFMLVVSGSSIYVPGCKLGQEDMLILNDSRGNVFLVEQVKLFSVISRL